MAPRTRASSVSTKIVGFRLTEEETQRLDELVKELGHKDRSAMLRAWLAQSGPIPRMADESPRHPAQSKTKTSAQTQQPGGIVETAHLNNDKQTALSNTPDVDDLIGMLKIAIQREKDPHTGWSFIPNVVRALLPHYNRMQIRAVMGILCVTSELDLHPGSRERLSREDEALCPRDAQGNAWTCVRWMNVDKT